MYHHTKNIRFKLSLDRSKLDSNAKSHFRILGLDSEFNHPIRASYSIKKETYSNLFFYYFINQSLEINEFKTTFKNPSSPSNPEKILIENNGEDPITINGIHTENKFFVLKDFESEVQLKAGDRLIVSLLFKPKEYGFYQSKLLVSTNMENHTSIAYNLYGVRKRGKSYYRYIDGVRYDRLLLEIAYSVMMQNEDQVIDYDQIRIITRNVWDSGYITTTEKRSLRYIWDNYDWSDNARKWFKIGYGYIL